MARKKTAKRKDRARGVRKQNRHEREQKLHSGGSEWDCISVPEGLEIFKPEKGVTYHIDVIPYTVGQYNKAADKGDEYYVLTYPVYRGLGIDEKKFVAIGDLLGVRDPVAEQFAQLKKEGAEWDDMKHFRAAKRQMMLFFVHEEPEKGLQFFEGAYGTFGELLSEEIASMDEEWVDNFDDPDGGATLAVRFKAKDIGMKHPWIMAGKINFEEREDGFTANGDANLTDEVLDKAATICLDDALKIVDYDTLKAVLHGEPVHDDVEEDDEEETPPPKKTRTRRKAKPEPEPEPEDEPEDDDDWEDDEEPEPEPEPEDEDEEDDDDWDDEDEEPEPPKKKPAPKKKAAAKKKAAPKKKPEPEPEEDEDDDDDWD